MKIRIISRPNTSQWGGDLTVINQALSGFKAIGIDASILPGNFKIEGDTNYIITNTCLDQRHLMDGFINAGHSYSCLPFHEDFRNYFVASIGMYNTCRQLLTDSIPISELEDYPEIINYAEFANPPFGINNRRVLQNAICNFPSSRKEELTIKRDSPKAHTAVIRLPTDVTDRFQTEKISDIFLDEYGIAPGYILQVGRLEVRKNQISTVLAARDIPVPLVFIVTKGYSPDYEKTFIEIIKKYRKYPTYIISEDMQELNERQLQIKNMKNNEKLDWSVLQSAYQNASVNCHPAFYELPGLTYIESIQLGVKTIVSNRATISEYLESSFDGVDVLAVEPGDIVEIRKAILDCLYGESGEKFKIPVITSQDYVKKLIKRILEWSAP